MPGAGNHPGLSRSGGFTLVELVVVLIVVGILSAFAIPRFANVTTFNVRGYSDQTLSILRYGQKLAIAENLPVYVRLTNSSVALCFDAACGSPAPAPINANSGSAATLAACSNNKNWDCEGAPSGVTITASDGNGNSYIGSNALFYFSGQGKPYKAGETEPVSTISKTISVTVSASTGNYVFTVEPETGYVHR
jgi:MSHA pilin protein MshC